MDRVKTLKLYAKNRRLPDAVCISNVPKEWIEYAYTRATNTNNTSDFALEQRTQKNIYGTGIEEYSELIKFYNQRYIDDLELPPEISKLEGVHHLRFGVLQPKSTIPMHLDEPYTLRFLCVISGEHNFVTELNNTYNMKAGELWFVNGSFKHSVENNTDSDRIALLGKFDNSENNLRLINELL